MAKARPGDAAQHAAEGQPAAAQHQPPGQRARQHALDDRLHQRGLRGRDLLGAERVGPAEQQHRGGHGPAGEGRADELPDLLARGGGAHQEAGLQVLRDVAGLRGRDGHDGAHGEHRRPRPGVDPAGRREDRGDAEQGHERDARGGLRGDAHDAHDAGGHGHEQHSEDAHARGADRALQRPHVAGEDARHEGGHQHHGQDAADHEPARQVAVGARRLGAVCAAAGACAGPAPPP